MNKLSFALCIICALLLSSCGSSKKYRGSSSKARVERKKLPSARKENQSSLKNAEVINSKSAELYSFIKRWEGVPHRMGGNSTRGVDCSGFVIQVYKQVYEDSFTNRRARDLYNECKPVKKSELREGDLVFFKIRSKHIDHVGIYLKNGDFVHVSSSRGVMVSNLNEAYFKKYYYSGGRKNS